MITTSPTSAPVPSSCFHKDTVISYKGANYSFAQLQNISECYIPHTVRTSGYEIEANCENRINYLKLTQNHLVFTKNGLKAAKELKPGYDIVFADVQESIPCEILSVTTLPETAEYFGLKCSTFEIMHEVPSLWMKFAGNIFGMHSASIFGDFFVRTLEHVKLL